MIPYPNINPVALSLGPLQVHWYGLMYLVGFLGAFALLRSRLHDPAIPPAITRAELSDIVFYTALGVILGGRIGYMLFYAWPEFIQHPLMIFALWRGGMSFHGGLIGVLCVLFVYARRSQRSFLSLTDFIAPVVPVGLAAGRIGNFINGELWGRVTQVPWAMVFPNADNFPRHPSQLYEFFLEGIALFIILWTFSKKPRPLGATSGLFLIGYGLIRFFVEFFREPDFQIGFIAWGWLTEGQLLSFPLLILGVGLLIWAYRRKPTCKPI